LPTQSPLLTQGSPIPTAALLQVAGVAVLSQTKPWGQSALPVQFVVQ
jgi:hypothetical protein